MITAEQCQYDLREELDFATRFARTIWNHVEAESAAGLALAQVVKLDLPSYVEFRKVLTITVKRRVVDAFRSEYGRNKGWTDKNGNFRNLYAKPEIHPLNNESLVNRINERNHHDDDVLSDLIIQEEIEFLFEPREQKILALLLCNYNLEEIGEALSVTPSRICQIRGEMKKKIRAIRKLDR